MNKYKSHKQEMAIEAIVEGSSIRSTERMTGIIVIPLCAFNASCGQCL